MALPGGGKLMGYFLFIMGRYRGYGVPVLNLSVFFFVGIDMSNPPQKKWGAVFYTGQVSLGLAVRKLA
jgi:hypothetical protein